ncbi:ankyrin repeat domain-containing protein [Treponema sp. OMZ 840]|uniref:ankyrin repeat domain-containing protein n=1 Tax=Treponema sp. OMZ 840 TaxID=244313 RepID=UPI003D8D95CC
MDWLLFTGKKTKKHIDALSSFFDDKKVHYTVIKADSEKFLCANQSENTCFEYISRINKATHCICLGADTIPVSPLFMYAVGLFSGKQLAVFSVPSVQMLPSCIGSSFGQSFYDVDALLASLKKDFPLYVKQEVQDSVKKKLFHLGIPLTPDSFSNYIARGDLDTSKLFLKAGMDVNIRDSAGTPMLSIAARSNKEPLVSWLIKKGADINAASEDRGYTPLMDAVWKNNYEIADILVKAGAQINTVAKDGQPLMVIATGICNIKICKLLYANGGDVFLKDRMGLSALDYARVFKKQILIDLFESSR